MKRVVIISLIVLVVGAMVVVPMITPGASTEDLDKKELPAVFTFEGNLATIGDQHVDLKIEIGIEKVEKVELIYDDETIMNWNNPKGILSYSFNAGSKGVGTRTLDLLTTLQDGSTFIDKRMVRVLSDVIPEVLNVQVIANYPHNRESFTQGMEFYDGKLFESTGDPGHQGKSLIAEVDIVTGIQHSKRSIGLDATYFGEGITLMNNTIYQLTWQSGKCFKYKLGDDIRLVGEFKYSGEGWGLCNDGKSIIMSNGTERIVFRNPETFEIERIIEVYNNNGPVTYLNELEYIDGKIYANVWTTNMIVVIDPISGKILQQIDATELVKIGRGAGEVLNGIAFNPKTNKIYLTGKNWDKLYEVKFVSPGVN